jgi:hypothetical protein
MAEPETKLNDTSVADFLNAIKDEQVATTSRRWHIRYNA